MPYLRGSPKFTIDRFTALPLSEMNELTFFDALGVVLPFSFSSGIFSDKVDAFDLNTVKSKPTAQLTITLHLDRRTGGISDLSNRANSQFHFGEDPEAMENFASRCAAGNADPAISRRSLSETISPSC